MGLTRFGLRQAWVAGMTLLAEMAHLFQDVIYRNVPFDYRVGREPAQVLGFSRGVPPGVDEGEGLSPDGFRSAADMVHG